MQEALAVAYAKENKYDLAFELMESLKGKDHPLSGGQILRASVLSKLNQGKAEQAKQMLLLFRSAEERYTGGETLCVAFLGLSDREAALNITGYFSDSDFGASQLLEIIILDDINQDRVDQGLLLIPKIKDDETRDTCLTALAQGCLDIGKPEQAFKLARQMKTPADANGIYEAVAEEMLRQEKGTLAIDVMAYHQSNLTDEKIVGLKTLMAAIKAKQDRLEWKVNVSPMVKANATLNFASYLMSVHQRDAAVRVIHQMTEEPDLGHTLIWAKACIKEGQFGLALDAARYLHTPAIQQQVYTAVGGFLGRANNGVSALPLMEAIPTASRDLAYAQFGRVLGPQDPRALLSVYQKISDPKRYSYALRASIQEASRKSTAKIIFKLIAALQPIDQIDMLAKLDARYRYLQNMEMGVQCYGQAITVIRREKGVVQIEMAQRMVQGFQVLPTPLKNELVDILEQPEAMENLGAQAALAILYAQLGDTMKSDITLTKLPSTLRALTLLQIDI